MNFLNRKKLRKFRLKGVKINNKKLYFGFYGLYMCGVRYVNVFVVPCDVYVHCAVLKRKDKNKILKEYPMF